MVSAHGWRPVTVRTFSGGGVRKDGSGLFLPSQRNRPFGYSYRLHKNQEFRAFFDSPEVWKFQGATVFRVRNQYPHFRLGMTLKLRVNSICRNRVKRQIREIFRNFGPILGNYDYNVLIPARRNVDPYFIRRLGGVLREGLRRELGRRNTF